MKKLILLTITLFIFSCSNHDKIKPPKDLKINWSLKNELSNYEVKYVQLNFDPFIDEDLMGEGIEEFLYKDFLYSLDSLDQIRLIQIVSDSSSFTRGECGTFALNAGFLFLQNDTIKGIIELGCGYAQWEFEPGNINAIDGSISYIGFDKMKEMLDDINRKMEKKTSKKT